MKPQPTFPEERFSAPGWLYQMTAGDENWHSAKDGVTPWYPSTYRTEMEEGKRYSWDTGQRFYLRGQGPIAAGDTLILFFCKTGKPDPHTRRREPGIYGWGTILAPPGRPGDKIEFELHPPSDFLKFNVLWDTQISQLLNEIRRVYQGNIWSITQSQLDLLRSRIHQHVSE